jgi:hypothetical protein
MYSGAFPSFLHVSSPELVQSAYHLDPLASTLVGAAVTGALVVGDGVSGGVGGVVGGIGDATLVGAAVTGALVVGDGVGGGVGGVVGGIGDVVGDGVGHWPLIKSKFALLSH